MQSEWAKPDNLTGTLDGSARGSPLGMPTFSAHIHGDIDLDYLFPKGTVGTSGTRNVVVT